MDPSFKLPKVFSEIFRKKKGAGVSGSVVMLHTIGKDGNTKTQFFRPLKPSAPPSVPKRRWNPRIKIG